MRIFWYITAIPAVFIAMLISIITMIGGNGVDYVPRVWYFFERKIK